MGPTNCPSIQFNIRVCTFLSMWDSYTNHLEKEKLTSAFLLLCYFEYRLIKKCMFFPVHHSFLETVSQALVTLHMLANANEVQRNWLAALFQEVRCFKQIIRSNKLRSRERRWMSHGQRMRLLYRGPCIEKVSSDSMACPFESSSNRLPPKIQKYFYLCTEFFNTDLF